MEEFLLYTDGGARGNPGLAAAGIVLQNPEGKTVFIDAKYLGEQTNNVAEYQALILGLQAAASHQVTNLKCHLDSELIVMQLNGAYRVKNKQLKKLFEQVIIFKQQFQQVKFVHVRRENNKIADKLVNIVLDAIQ